MVWLELIPRAERDENIELTFHLSISSVSQGLSCLCVEGIFVLYGLDALNCDYQKEDREAKAVGRSRQL